MTLRSFEVLKSVDGVIVEDSRRGSQLLNHYQISKPLLVLNDFNESKNLDQIIEKLKSGQNLALISDAGTPLISDPGFKLVREELKNNLQVDSLPGPSSVITALTLSSRPPDTFMFLGYPPDKSGHSADFYQKIKAISDILPTTFIIFVAPHKLVKTLTEIKVSLGNIDITLAKELTKVYQNVESKKISDWIEQFSKQNPKGEFVLLTHLP